MISSIDGKIQHLKELDFIERYLYNLMNPERYYDSLRQYFKAHKEIGEKEYLTLEEVKNLDDYTREYFYNKIPEFQSTIIRAYVIGRLLVKSDEEAKIFDITVLNKIPAEIKATAKKLDLTKEQALQLKAITEKAGINITNTTAHTIKIVKDCLTTSIEQGEGISGAEKRIRETITGDEGELNRDWKRVAITETNQAFNNGYLSNCKEGSWVIGISMPDCCDFCFTNIKGKVFQVISKPVKEEDWINKVWIGKDNIHRSIAKNKRINPEIGNKPNNLKLRANAEKAMPVCPAHPYCRCRYSKFFPDIMYLDNDGNIKLKFENETAYQDWYNDNIEGY